MTKLAGEHLQHQDPKRVAFARTLRKSMTVSERILWEELRGRKHGCKYRRQVPLGNFIADFCCMKHRVLIEIDGGIHEQQHEYDAMREEYLLNSQFKIIRLKNSDVEKDLRNAIERIREMCK